MKSRLPDFGVCDREAMGELGDTIRKDLKKPWAPGLSSRRRNIVEADQIRVEHPSSPASFAWVSPQGLHWKSTAVCESFVPNGNPSGCVETHENM